MSYQKSYKEIDVEKGTYERFKVICDREGADAAGRQAAFRYCRKAASMGGKWVSFNEMTERHEYLYVKRQFITEFKNGSMYLESVTEKDTSRQSKAAPKRKSCSLRDKSLGPLDLNRKAQPPLPLATGKH